MNNLCNTQHKVLCKTSSYTITKDSENNCILSLMNMSYESSYILYKSIIATNENSLCFVDPVKNELHFRVFSGIRTLLDVIKGKQRMSNMQCMLMISYLSKQMQELEKMNYSLLGFTLQDIIIIDESIFVFVNNEHLLPLDKNISENNKENNKEKYMNLFKPISKPYFSNPELIELTKLPAKIHYKSCYYSLAALVIFCLLEEYLFKGNEIKNDVELEDILRPICYTKMYWFLKRCLVSSPEKREMLFI